MPYKSQPFFKPLQGWGEESQVTKCHKGNFNYCEIQELKRGKRDTWEYNPGDFYKEGCKTDCVSG